MEFRELDIAGQSQTEQQTVAFPEVDADYKRRAFRLAVAQIAVQSTKIAQLRAELALSAAVLRDPIWEQQVETSTAVLLPKESDSCPPADQGNEKIQSSDEFIRLEIDLPKSNNGRVEETVSLLKIAGWAIAESGICELSVQIDERPPVEATRGIRRVDVGAAFPNVSGASLSGYGLLLTHRDVGIGEHVVKITARSNSGRTAERAFRIHLEAPDDAELTLRGDVPQAEIDQRAALLRAADCAPIYSVLVRADSIGSGAAEALRASLRALEKQAYSLWRAMVVLPKDFRDEQLMEGIGSGKLAGRVTFHGDVNAALKVALAPHSDGGRPVSQQFLLSVAAGDLLGADALMEFSAAASLDSSAEFFYADERCLDPTLGVQPWLKPDWSPELLLSMNYIGHVWAAAVDLVRRAVAEDAAIFVNGFYDTVLRLTERSRRITHVPKLISECQHPRLTHDVRDEAALEHALARRGIRGEVIAGSAAGTWRVRRDLDAEPLVSIIIPTCGTRDLVKTAIQSIRRNTDYSQIEIICIDNIPAGRQDLKLWLRNNANHVVDLPEKFNWSRFNNLAAQVARGEYFLFLNDDIEITHAGWLTALVEHAQRPEVGVVGARLLYPNGTVQHAGIFYTPIGGRHAFRLTNPEDPGPFGLAAVQRDVAAVTGACQLVRRSTFEMLGGYDERHAVIKNDGDFCRRAQKHGLAVIYTPFATLMHHELVSRGDIPDTYDEAAFRAAWAADLALGDPFFNPGLSIDDDNYVPDPEPVQVLYTGHPIVDRQQIRHILAVKLDHIGDFVLAIPALKRLKERFPHAKLTVLAAPASCVLARNEAWIDHSIEFSFFDARSEFGQRDITEEEMSQLEARLRSINFDLAVDLRMHTDTREILLKTGAKFVAGFDKDQQFRWLDFAINWEGDTALVPKRAHVADRLLDLVNLIDGACERGWPMLTAVTADDARRIIRTMDFADHCPAGFFDRPLVCVHPGVGSPIRQWPTASYAALVDLLIERAGVNVVLIGAGDEEAIAAAVAQNVVRSSNVVSAAGRVPLKDLSTLIRACVLFIGNNSGPKHIAAALGIPTIGVHSGNVDPLEWGPVGEKAVTVYRKVFCGPCYIADPKACSRKLACLTGIRPEHVFNACLPYLRSLNPIPLQTGVRNETTAAC